MFRERIVPSTGLGSVPEELVWWPGPLQAAVSEVSEVCSETEEEPEWW